MPDTNYDPQKAHEYYLRIRQLKGRSKGGSLTPKGRSSVGSVSIKEQERSARLTEKIRRLQTALHEAQTALREKEQKSRTTAAKTAKKNSDNKTTAKERQATKQYRDKHKSEIASKAKKSDGSGKGKTDVSSMSTDELKHRVQKLKSLISEARSQLGKATAMAHSSILSPTEVLSQFANGIERPLTQPEEGR